MLCLVFSKSCSLIFKEISFLSRYIFNIILWLWRSKYIYTVIWKISSSLLCLKWCISSFLLKILIVQFKIFIYWIFWRYRLILKFLISTYILIILSRNIHEFLIRMNFNILHFYFRRLEKIIEFKKFYLSVSIIFYSSDNSYKLTINSLKSICFQKSKKIKMTYIILLLTVKQMESCLWVPIRTQSNLRFHHFHF